MDEPALDLTDLASDMTIGELMKFLDRKFAAGSDVTLEYTTIESRHSPAKSPRRNSGTKSLSPKGDAKFGQLPPELLSRIMKQDPKTMYASHLINKTIGNYAKANILEEECNKTISKEEIIREMKATDANIRGGFHDIILIQKTRYIDEDGLETIKLEVADSWDWKTMTKNSIQCKGFTYDIYFDYESIYKRKFKQEIWIDFNRVEVDIFKAYDIRTLRTTCMERDPLYAEKWLVKDYNSKFPRGFKTIQIEGELEYDITFDEILTIYVAAITASLIDNTFRKIQSLNPWANPQNLIDKYVDARKIIRNEVVAKTDAKWNKTTG
jgi:uncharacterized protein YqgQ